MLLYQTATEIDLRHLTTSLLIHDSNKIQDHECSRSQVCVWRLHKFVTHLLSRLQYRRISRINVSASSARKAAFCLWSSFANPQNKANSKEPISRSLTKVKANYRSTLGSRSSGFAGCISRLVFFRADMFVDAGPAFLAICFKLQRFGGNELISATRVVE